MALSIDVDMTQFNAPIERFLSILAHPKPILLQAIQVGQSSVQTNFVRFGRPAWKERSPVTIKILQNQRKGSIGVLMRITSHLMNATGLAGRPGADGAIIADDNEAVLENRVEYARKLQYGDPGGDPITETVRAHKRRSKSGKSIIVASHVRHTTTRSIPPRPFMIWQTEDVADVEAYCIDYIQNRINGGS